MLIDPISNGLPDCSFPLIFYGYYEEFPYGMAGTGFLVRDADNAYFVTARHCLGSSEEAITKAVETLCIPVLDSTYDVLRITAWGEAISPNVDESDLPGGKLDLVVMTIDLGDPGIRAVVFERAAILPPTGDWIQKVEVSYNKRMNGKACYEVPLKVKGFPKKGTESEVDVDSRNIVTQGVVVTGFTQWEASFPHTKNIVFSEQTSPISDFDGMSGSPVFIKVSSTPTESYALAGVLIRASNFHGQFITVRWLVRAIREAAKQNVGL
jgi:V8-like Glu-specific endopeptidase